MFLTFKEFPPELIDFVENLFQIKEIRCKLFYWNKNELRVCLFFSYFKKKEKSAVKNTNQKLTSTAAVKIIIFSYSTNYINQRILVCFVIDFSLFLSLFSIK